MFYDNTEKPVSKKEIHFIHPTHVIRVLTFSMDICSMELMTSKKYFFIILILGSLTALAPFSIDMYLPGFPAIAKDLQTSASKVSLTLTGFFIGICFGQLLYGPLLDRFGRKPPLYIGLVVYIMASVACAFSHTINSLIILRCIQAIGSCAATVTAVALVRDLFPVKDSAKVFALLILVLGASPLIAPTVGGYITSAFGWHTIFIILTIMATLLLIACILWLPDVYKPNMTLSLKPLPIIHSFWEVFIEPQFYTYSFTSAIAFAGLFAYVSGSPIIFMNVFGLSAKQYGWVFAFLSIGFIGFSQFNNLLVRRFSSEQIVRTALIGYAIVGSGFIIASVLNLTTLPVTIAFLFLSLICIGIASPNASSLCLAPFTKNAGTAAALMGAIQMGIGALISAFVSLFTVPSTLPVASAIAGSAVLALTILLIGKRFIIHKVDVQKDTTEGVALH